MVDTLVLSLAALWVFLMAALLAAHLACRLVARKAVL